MSSSTTHAAECVGPTFSVDGMLLARQKTRQAITNIANRITPGMLEEDAVAMAKTSANRCGHGAKLASDTRPFWPKHDQTDENQIRTRSYPSEQ